MISILIPVYNRNVNQLASTLSSQLSATNQPGEIILLDDGSGAEYRKANAATANLPHVKYIEAGTNHGRVRIRQLLAVKANYTWLLFLDCDSMIISAQFLQKYFNEILPFPEYPTTPEYPGLFVGGRIYQQQPPGDCNLRLHWQYGRKREAIDAAKRNEDPYPGFMSNNFMIHKMVFSQLKFADDWQGYGHEDTWIGMQLEANGMKIKFLDNAILHDGLETATSFLQKTEQALQNLNRLQKLVNKEQLKRHVKLYRAYSKFRSAGLLWIPKLMYGIRRKKIEKNLHNCRPSLYYFDLYRLNRFIQITRST